MTATTEEPKVKKFYKNKERIWIKPLKRTGVVVALDTTTKDAVISFRNESGEPANGIFKFWEIDKLRSRNVMAPSAAPGPVLEIPVKYLTEGVKKLEKIEIGDWIDVSTAEDVTLLAFEYRKIPLGFAMQLPVGFEAHVVPRSSTYEKWYVIQANAVGIIDNSYSGDGDEWKMPVLAIHDTYIPKGTRIGQFRILPKMGKVQFIEKETLGNPDRGGFGSTGK